MFKGNRWKIVSFAVVAIAFLGIRSRGVAAQTGSGEPLSHAIDPVNYLDPQQYGFLSRTLDGVEVVGLGESIHFTHEFPLVRTGIVRYLNENMGFHILATEGSAVDLWATQDRLLASQKNEADIELAQKGLFSVWNTEEMRPLLRYEVASWGTTTPLYITAYDIQPGSGEGTPEMAAFELLVERLRTYADQPASFDEGAWVSELAPLTDACKTYQPQDDPSIERGIASLEAWIAKAAPEVQQRFPNLPHATVLRLIPPNLRASLALCQGVGPRTGSFPPNYKETRDRNASGYALALKTAAPGGKLMLWGHLSHLFLDSTGRNTSVGEMMRKALGSKFYTLVAFGEGGATILIVSDVNDQMLYAPVHGAYGKLHDRVGELCPSDCFLDLRGTQDPLFMERQRVSVEAFPWSVALAKDMDGAIFIRHVHPPEMKTGKLLILGTMLFWEPPVVYFIVVILVVALALAIRRSLKRPAKRPQYG